MHQATICFQLLGRPTMPAHWSIEDGQFIPLTTFTGDDHPHPSGVALTTDPANTSTVLLALMGEDGSSYTFPFNRNGVPSGPPVKVEAPAKTGAALAHSSEAPKR